MNIEINNKLLDRLNVYLKETSFKNPAELVEFIISDYLDKNTTDVEDTADNKILEERLKNLGYL